MDWLDALTQLRREGSPAVLITVTKVRGHAPREAGAKMVVSSEHSWASVGGGNLEESAIHRARELISSGAAEPETQLARLNEHARNEHGRQCCGGEVTLLLEPMRLADITAGADDVTAHHHLLLGGQLLERLPRGASSTVQSSSGVPS